ncbi:VC0807 family protein [Halobacillus campisalis]|uniref:VC0807 family protein n=1 Tax=Halobacillus campisalis TaxID=435909 RepID=A0ABW2K7G8_9BACI|nr:VC0807 family protein [Halobacillus campisalis]
MKNHFVLLDLIFYVVFPLAVWNLTRDPIGDYYAMLLSSVPGIIYTVYRFMALKKVNVFGLYMISTLVVGTLIDVLAGNAIRLLWYNVIYAYVLAGLFLLTIVIKKPIALYFALDFTELQGDDRAFNKRLFYQKKIYRIFSWIVAGFAFQNILSATLKAWLITEYGVEAFDKGIILRQVINWGLTFIIMAGFFYISKVINESPQLIEKVKQDMKEEKLSS